MSTSQEQRKMMGPYQRLALGMANMTLGVSQEARVVLPGVTYIGPNDVILGAEFWSEGRGMWRYTFRKNDGNVEILGYEEPKVNDPNGGGSPSQATMIADAGGMFTWKAKTRLVHYRIGMLVELCVVLSKLIPLAVIKETPFHEWFYRLFGRACEAVLQDGMGCDVDCEKEFPSKDGRLDILLTVTVPGDGVLMTVVEMKNLEIDSRSYKNYAKGNMAIRTMHQTGLYGDSYLVNRAPFEMGRPPMVNWDRYGTCVGRHIEPVRTTMNRYDGIDVPPVPRMRHLIKELLGTNGRPARLLGPDDARENAMKNLQKAIFNALRAARENKAVPVVEAIIDVFIAIGENVPKTMLQKWAHLLRDRRQSDRRNYDSDNGRRGGGRGGDDSDSDNSGGGGGGGGRHRNNQRGYGRGDNGGAGNHRGGYGSGDDRGAGKKKKDDRGDRRDYGSGDDRGAGKKKKDDRGDRMGDEDYDGGGKGGKGRGQAGKGYKRDTGGNNGNERAGKNGDRTGRLRGRGNDTEMEQDDDNAGAQSMQDGDMKTWLQVSLDAGINWDEAKIDPKHPMQWVEIDEQKKIAMWADEYEKIDLNTNATIGKIFEMTPPKKENEMWVQIRFHGCPPNLFDPKKNYFPILPLNRLMACAAIYPPGNKWQILVDNFRDSVMSAKTVKFNRMSGEFATGKFAMFHFLRKMGPLFALGKNGPLMDDCDDRPVVKNVNFPVWEDGLSEQESFEQLAPPVLLGNSLANGEKYIYGSGWDGYRNNIAKAMAQRVEKENEANQDTRHDQSSEIDLDNNGHPEWVGAQRDDESDDEYTRRLIGYPKTSQRTEEEKQEIDQQMQEDQPGPPQDEEEQGGGQRMEDDKVQETEKYNVWKNMDIAWQKYCAQVDPKSRGKGRGRGRRR